MSAVALTAEALQKGVSRADSCNPNLSLDVIWMVTFRAWTNSSSTRVAVEGDTARLEVLQTLETCSKALVVVPGSAVERQA